MKYFFRHIAVLLLCSVMLGIDGCTSPENQSELSEAIQSDAIEAEEYPDSSPFDAEPKEQEIDQEPSLDRSSDTGDLDIPDDSEKLSYSEPAPSDLAIVQDIRPSFSHRLKSAEYQKYIVLHDTEGDSDLLLLLTGGIRMAIWSPLILSSAKTVQFLNAFLLMRLRIMLAMATQVTMRSMV